MLASVLLMLRSTSWDCLLTIVMQHALHEPSWRRLPSLSLVDLGPGAHLLKGVPSPLHVTFPPQAG